MYEKLTGKTLGIKRAYSRNTVALCQGSHSSVGLPLASRSLTVARLQGRARPSERVEYTHATSEIISHSIVQSLSPEYPQRHGRQTVHEKVTALIVLIDEVKFITKATTSKSDE